MKNSTPTTKTSHKKAPQKHIVNVLKKDNQQRKVKKAAQSFAQTVKEINDPRTSEGALQYPLDEILFTALAAVISNTMSKSTNLIVGAGISGVSLARKIAEEWNEPVTVIDAKPHIGGNCFDERQDGVMVHRYGTHIFHTDDKNVWDFLSRFTKWYPYQHKVRGLVDGQVVPIPFNLNSLHQLFPQSMAVKMENRLLKHFGFNQKIPILELRKTGDKDLEFLAEYVYQKIFLEYTLKQWELKPDEIDPEITGRVPVFVSRDDRYFQDKYQGIPLEGYTAMIEKMLDHPNISVKLNTPYKKAMTAERMFYTGSIDEFFDYQFGELPYRSIELDFVTFNKLRFQEAAVVNYPCNYDWTRIG